MGEDQPTRSPSPHLSHLLRREIGDRALVRKSRRWARDPSSSLCLRGGRNSDRRHQLVARQLHSWTSGKGIADSYVYLRFSEADPSSYATANQNSVDASPCSAARGIHLVNAVTAKVGIMARDFPREARVSGSSSWACVFRPGRAGLPASLPGGTARSGKCSWSFSGRRATKAPCHRESPFWPWSGPGRSGR